MINIGGMIIDGRRGLLAVQLLLVVSIAYVLIRSIIIAITPEVAWQDMDIETNATSSSGMITGRISNNLPSQSILVNFDPFHSAIQLDAPIVGDDAPETTLDLKLFGRRAGEDGSAILQTPDRQQAAYRIGDEIIDGVFLKAVTPDYVVLSQDGRLERLSFERDEQQKLTSTSRSESLSRQASLQSPTVAASSNFSAPDFLSTVALSRETVDGILVGYKIRPRTANANLGALGLRDGDIITRIGDEDLTRGQPEFSRLMRELSRLSAAEIALLRNGEPMTLKVNIP